MGTCYTLQNTDYICNTEYVHQLIVPKQITLTLQEYFCCPSIFFRKLPITKIVAFSHKFKLFSTNKRVSIPSS